MATLTAARFQQLLAEDPAFIIDFITGNNPNGVADKLEVLIGTRPASAERIDQALNYLLNNERGDDFVQALNVPLDLGALSTDQATAAFAGVPIGYTAQQGLAKALALRALRLWQAAEVDAPAPPETVAQTVTKAVTTPSTAPKHRAVRYLIMGLALVGLVWIVVATVKAISKAA
jgi:hypothetical protein